MNDLLWSFIDALLRIVITGTGIVIIVSLVSIWKRHKRSKRHGNKS